MWMPATGAAGEAGIRDRRMRLPAVVTETAERGKARPRLPGGGTAAGACEPPMPTGGRRLPLRRSPNPSSMYPQPTNSNGRDAAR